MTDSNSVAGSRDFGQLSHRDGRPVIEFTRRFPHSPEKVWRALTQPDHLALRARCRDAGAARRMGACARAGHPRNGLSPHLDR